MFKVIHIALIIVLVFCPSAMAEESKYYFGVSGGYTMMGDMITNEDSSIKEFFGPGDKSTGVIPKRTATRIRKSRSTLKDGFSITTAFGRRFGKWRGELEYGYRKNSISRINKNDKGTYDFDGSPTSAFGQVEDPTGSVYIHSFMTNAFRDFHNKSIFTPYIGAGVGIAWQKLFLINTDRGGNLRTRGRTSKEKTPERTVERKTTFAYQAMIGVAVKATEKISLVGGFRFFGTDEEVKTTSLEGSVRYSF